ncbi:MAG: polysaccharide deacetylase [Lachnospiraceae bacterium]|nr:polysaccharide deacetylase [Lachnospiraceae bacterium]
MVARQRSGKIRVPDGKTVAVSITFDCDALTLWQDSTGQTGPVSLSRGEYGMLAGIPRILDMLERYGIKTTFFVPGRTADTYPEIIREIIAAGHEIGWHGYSHANNTTMSLEEEDRAMQMGIDAICRCGAPAPIGYRAPSCDYSPNTMGLLTKYGFRYASNLMGNDNFPYYPCPVIGHSDRGNEFAEPLPILELPLSYQTDDIIFIEYVNKFPWMPPMPLRPTSELFQREMGAFDYACKTPGSEVILVNHPQATGHPEFIMNMERMIEHMQERGAWLVPCKDIYEAFIPDAKEDAK